MRMKKDIMIKKCLLTLFCVVTTQIAFAFNNSIDDSYGTWVGGEEPVVISNHGFEEFYKENLTKKCFGKILYKQEMLTRTGKELLDDLDMAISYMLDDDKDKNHYDIYIGRLQLIKTFINKDQSYKSIYVNSNCGDGSEEFVILSPNDGIFIQTGGDSAYYFVRKLK